MSKAKLTDWFPADVKPVHVGVYEVLYENGCFGSRYRYWNGVRFCYQCMNSQKAFQKRNNHTGLDAFVSWRGIAEKPN
jgi:hypothetical protein